MFRQIHSYGLYDFTVNGSSDIRQWESVATDETAEEARRRSDLPGTGGSFDRNTGAQRDPATVGTIIEATQ
jgi:hypothetical protein